MKMSTACHKLITISLVSLMIYSCSDPTIVGSDLLDDIKANVSFTDTVTMTSTSISGPDSSFTFQIFNPFSRTPYAGQLSSFLVGKFEDPLYGESELVIFTQPRIGIHNNSNSSGQTPDFANNQLANTFDSLVLLLPYDSAGFYGNLDQEFSLEVYRVIEDMPQAALFDIDEFLIDGTPIGSKTFKPDTTARPISFLNVNSTDTLLLDTFPYLTIRLDDNFGRALFNADTSVYANEDSFIDFMKGIQIRAVSKNNATLSFDLTTGNEETSSLGSLGGMYLYYTTDIGENPGKKQFYYNFWSQTVRTVNLKEDKSNGEVSNYISSEGADSLTFVRSISKVQTKVTFPYVEALKGKLLNKAELIMYIRDYENDPYPDFPPIDQIIVFQRNTAGELNFVEDLNIIAQAQANEAAIAERFGGVIIPGENGEPDSYKITITAALQNMIDGTIQNEILIGSYNDIERANHSVLYGANHPQFPFKLNITFVEQ